MQSPRVSIIIPVFNGANYMRLAIDSALAQTWLNTEVIVVNDGSRDDGETECIARSYGDRIRYISKPNGGVASALNAGVKAMTGDVFCWLSHDDRHLPEKTATQVRKWERLGRPDAVLISDYRLIDAAGSTIADVRLDHDLLVKKPSYALLRGSIHGCSVFVPKALFERVGLFNEGLPTTQDYDLWHRSFRQFPFVHMPNVLIESRWHDEQGSKKIDHVVEATAFWTRVVDSIPECDQVEWEGSSYRFLSAMAGFLRGNRLAAAADEIDRRAQEALNSTLVSVVIPLFNRVDMAVSAIESVAAQTHPAIEIIVVDDGCTENMTDVRAAIARHPRGRLIRQKNAGPASARNNGWRASHGKYVAFLDADDLFLPTKVADQLLAMEASNQAFSHTSYYRYFDGDIAFFDAGARNTFPEIIGSCGIATPTVMLKRSLLEEGFDFPEAIRCGEDVVLWLRIGAKHGTFGIDKGLTIVRASRSSAAYDRDKLIRGVDNIMAAIMESPDLNRHSAQVEQIRLFAADLRKDPAYA
jgi:glycosyltransferase involved in cell wall biosynthesis